MALLAYDAAALIDTLEAAGPSPEKEGTVSETEKATIYLAECSADRRETREKLIVDLKLNGYAVVPEKPLPLDNETAYREEAAALLEASGLSVHLVGATPGTPLMAPARNPLACCRTNWRHSPARTAT